MNTDIHSKSHKNQLHEAAEEITRQTVVAAKSFIGVAEDAAGDIADSATATAKSAADTAKGIYQSAKGKAVGTYVTSSKYVCRNPVPVVLGAFAFGAALGCLLMMSRRKPTFRECYAEEPMGTVREVILDALAPVTERMHKGYDSARCGAEKVIGRVHDFGSGRTRNSISDQIGRMGNNLKFW